MRRKKSALKFVFPLVCLVIIFFGGIFIFRSLMGKFLSSAFPTSVPETPAAPRLSASTSTASTTEVLRPSASTTSTANGSFTELFSGTGWLNQEKSNVYQDQKLSSISFPPDYEWKEVPELSNALKDETIIAADGNGKEIVLVTKSGKIMSLRGAAGDEAISINQSSIINNQLRSAALDYDDSAGVWIVAASSDSGIEVGPVNRPVSVNAPGAITDLACANAECLVNYGSSTSIGSFSINNPSELSKINLQSGKSFNSISLGSVDPRSDSRLLAYMLVGAVEKKDGTYTGSIFKYNSPFPKGSTPQGGGISSSPFLPVAEKLFSSPYPGTIRFGYDSENDEILALYAAYIGQAYKFSVNPLLVPEAPRQSASILSASTTEDYSRFFSQRVMGGNIIPKIFKYGNAWWLSSGINQSSIIKFIRIEGAAGIDFADILIGSKQLVMSGVEPSFELLPGFNLNTLYGITGGQSPKIYKFTDNGYKKDKKIAWESVKLNRFDNEITGGKFYKINGSADNIRYYLSNDGGKNWQETKLNEMVNFSTKGNDFRFKVELNPVRGLPRQQASATGTSGSPASNGVVPGADKFQTPWLNLVSVEYYAKP